MCIPHKFLLKDFGNGFQTHNAVLDVLPYAPVAMFVGTNNPDTKSNFADFFYGRNYLWPGLSNLFIYNKVELDKPRMPKKGKPSILNPSKKEIFELCFKLKLTFADLILSVFNGADNYRFLENDNVIFNGNIYNLIQDQKNKGILGLADLDKIGRVDWNTNNIIHFLNIRPTIKTVYLTRQPDGVWAKHWEKIKSEAQAPNRNFVSIYTPSAQGGALHQQTQIYKRGKMLPLLSHWVNNANGKLDNGWLTANGATIENF